MDSNKQKSKISYQPQTNYKTHYSICNKNILKSYLMDIQPCRRVKKVRKLKYYMLLGEFKDFLGGIVIKRKTLRSLLFKNGGEIFESHLNQIL